MITIVCLLLFFAVFVIKLEKWLSLCADKWRLQRIRYDECGIELKLTNNEGRVDEEKGQENTQKREEKTKWVCVCERERK